MNNFIKNYSAPTAIEIIETTFSSPKILLFYPTKQEVFSADLLKYEGEPQWIVRGPFQMEKEDFNKLNEIVFNNETPDDLKNFIRYFYINKGVDKITFAPLVEKGAVKYKDWIIKRNQIEIDFLKENFFPEM